MSLSLEGYLCKILNILIINVNFELKLEIEGRPVFHMVEGIYLQKIYLLFMWDTSLSLQSKYHSESYSK